VVFERVVVHDAVVGRWALILASRKATLYVRRAQSRANAVSGYALLGYIYVWQSERTITSAGTTQDKGICKHPLHHIVAITTCVHGKHFKQACTYSLR